MSGDCQEQLAILQSRVSALERENQRLKHRVNCLLLIIEQVGAIALKANQEAETVLSQKSGVAPRPWGFAKGVQKITQHVLQKLQKIGECG